MPPDSEGNSGLNPSCVSAGGASHESSRLNEHWAEDYALMQEAASKFSTRNELIALILFSFLKDANEGNTPWHWSSQRNICMLGFWLYLHPFGRTFFFFFLNNNRKCTMDLPAVNFFVMVKYGFQWGHYPLKIPFKLSPSIKSFHVFGGLASSSTVSLKGFFPNIRPLDKWFRFMPAELISQKKHKSAFCFL